jgi:ribosomal protein S18 acetylase RimI-like enzyme
MTGIIIRRSVPEDAEAVERLRVAGWQRAYRGIIPDDYLDRLVPNVARRRRHLAGLPAGISDSVAVADGAVVGWIAGGPCRDPDRLGPRYGEIFACYVHPGCWRKGAGRLLMDHALEALVQAGRDDVSLWVLEANERARRFYATVGFGPDGARMLRDFGAPVAEVRYLRPARTNGGSVRTIR